MFVAHKIALSPTPDQETYFRKAAGTARFAYNWALDQWVSLYRLGEKPSEAMIRKNLNKIKYIEFPWMKDVSKTVPQQSIKNLGKAFNNFFNKRAKYPKYKKLGRHDAFRADNGPQTKGADAVQVNGKSVGIPKLGWVRMREALRFEGQIKSATISRRAQRWYISFLVDSPLCSFQRENQAVGGVDLGLRWMAVTSDGVFYENPKPLKANLRKLKRLQRQLRNKKKGSNRRTRLQHRIAELHVRIADIRKDALHKATTSLVRDYSTIVIEDLNVVGMLKNRYLSRAVSDVGLYEFRRQLEYKAKWYGTKVLLADRWFPSSKLCSCCGYKYSELKLGMESWVCPVCKTEHDRDRNAAINLREVLPEVTHVETTSSTSLAGLEKQGRSMKRELVERERYF